MACIHQSVPQIEPDHHEKASESSKQCREFGLPRKPTFDRVEEGEPLLRRLEATNNRNDNGRHKTHASDPKNDRENMQSTCNRYIIHYRFSIWNNNALDVPGVAV
jgi:hypothetical protein